MYNKILIAVDGSEHSLRIAEKGLNLAKQLGAEAALLFVIDKGKTFGNVDANITHNEAEILLKREAVYLFDSIASTFGISDFVRFMPIGFPKEDIIKVSELWHADVIVIGTHGKSGLLNVLLGSVAEHILHQSRIAVMLIK